MVIGYWLLVIGYWLLVIGYWLLVIGYWLLVISYWLSVPIPPLRSAQWLMTCLPYAYLMLVRKAIAFLTNMRYARKTYALCP
ncbi:hypothetical protein [Microcoleus sp. LEGE 07076]|uniref:hypothetical protein n=1 Tax=Microcoleus sp. LEGE 07076 TaxID=915322 RepID=UPI0030D92112